MNVETNIKIIKKRFAPILFEIKNNKLSLIGIIMVSFIILVAIFAPAIARYGPYDQFPDHRLEPPSSKFLFGTDDLGRDVFSRVIYGTRISLKIGLTVVILAMGIGAPLGAIAGYFGGKIDDIIMRISDVFLGFPPLLLAIAIAFVLGPNIMNAMIAISATWWPWYTRLVHGQAMALKEQNFVKAARSIGVSGIRIVIRHILPNCIGPIIVQGTLDMGYTILTATSLSFIGVGAQSPLPEWGLMISTGRIYYLYQPWIALFPGIAIFLLVLSFNLMGDSFRDILDPTLRGR